MKYTVNNLDEYCKVIKKEKDPKVIFTNPDIKDMVRGVREKYHMALRKQNKVKEDLGNIRTTYMVNLKKYDYLINDAEDDYFRNAENLVFKMLMSGMYPRLNLVVDLIYPISIKDVMVIFNVALLFDYELTDEDCIREYIYKLPKGDKVKSIDHLKEIVEVYTTFDEEIENILLNNLDNYFGNLYFLNIAIKAYTYFSNF